MTEPTPPRSPLLDEIRAEQAKLEALRRRKGIATVSSVREALPPFLRNQASTSDLAAIARALNAAAEDADPVPSLPFDHHSRAVGPDA